ncbi:MAG: hypothetical protein HQK51_07800 [Oligoflexia bacterium]|nr:hypothetical protein [Oligoflexia bacterium]
MKLSNHKVKIYLLISIILLSFLPMIVTYIFLDEILDSTLNFKIHKDTISLLKESQQDLKLLRDLHPDKTLNYRDRFYQIINEIKLLDSFDINKSALKRSFLTYFVIGATVSIIMALCLSLYLSMKISKSYKRLLNENINQSKRLSRLEHLHELKEVARMMAHEIKNPLTPIEMMISNLLHSLNNSENSDIKINPSDLKETSKIVLEELSKLKKMLHSFSSFSKLPKSELQKINFIDYLNEFIKNYKDVWEDVTLSFDKTSSPSLSSGLIIELDTSIFRQVLINLINNAQEANKSTKIDINIKLNLIQSDVFSDTASSSPSDTHNDIDSIQSKQQQELEIHITNTGKSIPLSERENIFKMHYTTKKETGHMGLGLKIVQTIVLEHHGEISCLQMDHGGAGFLIKLPVCS